jgi:alpha/beta superfamily hydrolase
MNSSILTTLPDTENPFFIPGPCGNLETIFFKAKVDTNKIAVLCHPHPLFEGTMHNKVIHTLSRAFHKKSMHSIRFNYRGVGKSDGIYGDSVGEIQDALAIIDWININIPNAELYLAGFSFGAYIAASCAINSPCKQLFSIAPAIPNQPYENLTNISCPWVVIQGEQDEVIPPLDVYTWFEQKNSTQTNFQLFKVPSASHFFHAKLIDLRTIVMDSII